MKALAVFCLAAILLAPIQAATLRVPADYPGIQNAIDAASTGDTVLVAPKLYDCHLNFGSKDIVLLSEAGPELTILRLDTLLTPLIYIGDGQIDAVVSGFTMIGTYYWGPAARIEGGASVEICNNRFIGHQSYSSGGHAEVYIRYAGSQVVIRDNLFINDENSGHVISIYHTSQMQIINNTFVGGFRAIYDWGNNTIIRNNIITGCGTGIYAVSNPSTDHNCVWGNDIDFYDIGPDPTDISVDPGFLSPADFNFLLSPLSPCRDAGNPDALYYDPDGSVADIGAFYFDGRTPGPYNLSLGSEDIAHVVSAAPQIHWSFYGIEQEGFELEVGSDNDWDGAEIWAPEHFVTSDTSVLYAGPSLVDGATYYYRLRLIDSAGFGPWRESVFRINSVSPAPVPQFPLAGDSTSVLGVELYVHNAYDAENDDLTYDYEVYNDPGMASLQAAANDRTEGRSVTSSGKIPGLSVGATYYWRARTFDSYEYSDWSALLPFTVRDPMVHPVPDAYATLQAAIDAAREGDTVLVGDGDYFGPGNVELDFHGVNAVLRSVNGPGAASITLSATEENSGSALWLHSGEDTTLVIDGITIGNGHSGLAGILFDSGAATIRNCVITGCSTNGIYISDSSFIILDSSRVEFSAAAGAFLRGNGRVTNSVFAGNDQAGLGLHYEVTVDVSNCTFVGNGWAGFYIEPEPPKREVAQEYGSIDNCIAAFNSGGGFYTMGWAMTRFGQCNVAYGNEAGDLPYDITPGVDGNIVADPLFCDTVLADYTVASGSPCAPANNVCAELIGALPVACICCQTRGNVDGDPSGSLNVSDLTYLVAHLFAGGDGPRCFEEGDVDASGTMNVSDVTYLVAFLFQGGPVPPDCS